MNTTVHQIQAGTFLQLLVLRAPVRIPEWFSPQFEWSTIQMPSHFLPLKNQWDRLDSEKFEARQDEFDTMIWSHYWGMRASEVIAYQTATIAQWPWYWARSIVKAQTLGET